MINIKPKSILSSVKINNIHEYNSAGSFFTDGKLVLSGYQQNKKQSHISGFGGKKEYNDNSYIETAIRETLEELFDIKPTIEIITIVNLNIIHKKLIIHNNYYILVYSFEDLELILNLLNKNNIASKLYDIFPLTISELIFNRKIDSTSEISHLCLLPLKKNINIDNDFIQDINFYLL
jgi:8-oxo-dGTP pyrophosphatase MutT (NUDIX family)